MFRASKTGLSSRVVFLLTIPPLCFFIVCTLVVSYVVFDLSLFVSYLSFCWCLGKAVLRECGIFWVSSLLFLQFAALLSTAANQITC